MRLYNLCKALLHDRRGTFAVEYGLILGIIVFGIMLSIAGLARETLKVWSHVDTEAAKAQQHD